MFDVSRNYFELFGLPADFIIDTDQLAHRYRELQRLVHPDRFAAAGQQSKRLSLQAATHVNEAYATLREPLARARYLLALHGMETGAQQTLTDSTFLMQQMDLREALEAVHAAEEPRLLVQRFVEEVDALLKSHLAELAVQFDDLSQERLAAAAQTVQKMQFLRKLKVEAESVQADLEEIL